MLAFRRLMATVGIANREISSESRGKSQPGSSRLSFTLAGPKEARRLGRPARDGRIPFHERIGRTILPGKGSVAASYVYSSRTRALNEPIRFLTSPLAGAGFGVAAAAAVGVAAVLIGAAFPPLKTMGGLIGAGAIGGVLSAEQPIFLKTWRGSWTAHCKLVKGVCILKPWTRSFVPSSTRMVRLLGQATSPPQPTKPFENAGIIVRCLCRSMQIVPK